ncbi:MAG TPA: polyprenyl synthetase family protein [Candidatus Methylomirabilis sp.]
MGFAVDAQAIQKIVFAPVAAKLDAVEAHLRSDLEPRGDLIGTVGNYVLGSGGKRVRPALLLLCANACGYAGGAGLTEPGGPTPRDVTLAAVAEWMHVATLMHDDVIDGADKRRGRPSANATWGANVSVLVGDYLYARSIQVLVDDGDPAILDTFAEATVRMAEAQVLEHELKGKLDVSLDDYLRIIAGKTAALIAASCRAGALVAGAPPEAVAAMTAFGRNLGIGFQLVDDALDYVAREERLGKPVGSDFRAGKITYPLIHCWREASEGDRRTLRALAARSALEAADVDDVRRMVERYGAVRATMDVVDGYLGRAKDLLAAVRDTPARHSLGFMIDFVRQRDW